MEPARHVRQIRIDIPFGATKLLMVVDANQSDWHPWWGELFAYLVDMGKENMRWTYEPAQKVHVSLPDLTDAQRKELAAFLRTAPAEEVERNRTLRRAIGLEQRQVSGLGLLYFSAGE